MFYGERLLTTDNPETDADKKLFERLGLTFEAMKSNAEKTNQAA